jgi:histidyl-tRNA synthetase
MRLEKNPLRILDSKDSRDKEAVANAPSILDFLNTRSREFFEKVCQILDGMGVKYIVKPSLVRGLDYYTDTIFEFVTTKLGSQGTVLAGGRYDNLIQQMGGPSVPAIGFAVGIERLMELFDGSINADRAVYVIGLDESCGLASMQLASKLRASGRYVHTECTNNLSKALKIAAQENARFVVLIGEDEIKSGQFRLKDMDARSETLLSEEQLIQEINRNER